MSDYKLLDSGNGRKLEQFGPYVLSRPASQAVWQPQNQSLWQKADATFSREEGGEWSFRNKPLPDWEIQVAGITFQLSLTDFGHLGIFPEQSPAWEWITNVLKDKERPKVLNLFAYSGGSTLAAAKGGAEVCHLDASKGMVAWARENAALNSLEHAPIRWITDDVIKFIKRENRRENRYDAIILDPPTFGRGSKGEVFKIEEDLPLLLNDCRDLLSPNPLFVLLSCHTPGFTSTTLHHLLSQILPEGHIEHGEMFLEGDFFPLPSGSYARWSRGN